MKFIENMKKKKQDNKGFSLVELIIVIAIMAILVGIVGTQVVPYLSKSKAAKDQQLLNSISTAAMTAYSENGATSAMTLTLGTAPTDALQLKVYNGMTELCGYTQLSDIPFESTAGQSGSSVTIAFEPTNKTLTVTLEGQTGKYQVAPVTSTL